MGTRHGYSNEAYTYFVFPILFSRTKRTKSTGSWRLVAPIQNWLTAGATASIHESISSSSSGPCTEARWPPRARHDASASTQLRLLLLYSHLPAIATMREHNIKNVEFHVGTPREVTHRQQMTHDRMDTNQVMLQMRFCFPGTTKTRNSRHVKQAT